MKNWIGVASAEHVAIGREAGFMQVCHGKAAPLRRLSPGDRILYYSPSQIFHGKDKLQSFTAIGGVAKPEPYQFEMKPGFRPFRRDVMWIASQPAPIAPLLDALDFTRGRRNWGYQFRFGILEINDHDLEIIAAAMSAKIFSALDVPCAGQSVAS